MNEHDSPMRSGRRGGSPSWTIAALGLATLALLVGPAAAGAASVTDVGEGFPFGINSSDQILIGKLTLEENAETHEIEEITEGPWSIWSGGKSTSLVPLNGAEKHEEPEIPHHELALSGINDAGLVAGSSTVGYTSEGKELTHFVPVWYDSEGAGHEVGLLQPTIKNKKGEAVPGAGVGTGIDNAGDVVGFDVVEEGGKLTGRGSFAAGGSSASAVGEADKPASSPWFSSVFRVNASGEMFGEVAEVDAEGANINPKYYFWKTAGEAGTKLNFDSFTNGFGIANDGSVLGGRAGKLYLRMPDGKEAEVAGMSKPFSVNSAHQVVGSATIAGKEVAAVWQGGTVTDLNKLLPENSGWVLKRAAFVNDAGDITGVGTHEGHTHVFLLKSGIVVTSAKDEKESSKASTGICATEKGGCTLRAAIETVNKAADSAVTRVTFNITGGKPAEITPATALPAITAPLNLEGASQPGAVEEGSGEEGRKVGVIIDGTKAAGANGLVLESAAAGSIVSGLELRKFGGDGVLLKGDHEQVADSILYSDKVGVEVAGSNDVVGQGEELAGNNFVEDGEATALATYIGGLKPGTAPKAYDEAIAGFGAAVFLGKGPTSGTQIQGNLIGIPGGLKSLLSLTAGVSTFGVLIDPASGAVTNVTIGGAGPAKNLISGDFTGVGVLGSLGTVSGVSIVGNQVGGNRGNGGESELGTIIGVMAEGNASGVQIGASSQGNSFPGDLLGVLLAGGELTGASVQGNTLGVDKGLKSFKSGLAGHVLLGVVAADTVGAQIGGAGAEQGNRILGAPLGIVIAGEKSSGNRVESNTVGRGSPPPRPFDLSEKSFNTEEFGGIIGLLNLSGQKQQIGSAGGGNTIQGNLFGVFSVESHDYTVQGNAIVKNGFGLFDLGSGGIQLGGSAPGQGNQIVSSAIGAFIANTDPTKQELEDAQSGEKAASNEVRAATLKEAAPGEPEALADVNATTTAGLSAAALEATPSKAGTNNRIEGNLIGTDAAGNTKSAGGEPLGSGVSLLIAGDEHQVVVGGTAAGQANQIVNGGSGGLLIAGSAAHAPSVQALGNKIYNNSTFGGSATGIPGLGISLIRVQGSGEIDPTFGFTVNPQDPIQPDQGPNSLQNSPILSSATSSGGQLTVAGTLQSVPNTSYTIELFTDEFKNPYGAGEGQQLVGRFNLATDASGHASFSVIAPVPGPNAQYVSATATTLPPGGEPGVTSEFALDAKIEAAAAGTPAPGPAPTGPTPAPGPTGVTTTAIVEHSGTLTVTVSGVKLTLPGVTVECAASSPGCSAGATATEGAGAGKASVAAHGKRKPKKVLVVLARWSARIAPGHTTPVVLTLTSQGRALLLRKHSLNLTVVISVKAGSAHATTRTLRVHVLQAKPKKKRKPHKH